MPGDTNLQPQPSSNEKSLSWKNILIGVAIGAILVGLGVTIYLLLQPKPTESTTTAKKATPSAKIATPSAEKDETVGWKVYTNELSGYSIKYPTNWVINEGSFQPNSNCQKKIDFEKSKVFIHDDLSLECVLISTHGYQVFQINDFNSPSDLSIYKEGTRSATGVEAGSCGTITTKFTQFADVKAVSITKSYNNCGGYVATNEMIFNYKDRGFIISIPVGSKGEVDPIYEKMLSTFRFE